MSLDSVNNQTDDAIKPPSNAGVENHTIDSNNGPRGRGRPKLYTEEESKQRKLESDRLRRERKIAERGRTTEPDSSTSKILGDAPDTVTGRKAVRNKASVLSGKPNGKVTENGQPVAVVDYASWGENAAQLIEMAGIQIFGSVGKYSSKEEREAMSAANANYFRSIGMTDLPPGWVLVGTVAMYTISRATTEEGSARIAKLIPKKKNDSKLTGEIPPDSTTSKTAS
jgi:hypothetical protein